MKLKSVYEVDVGTIDSAWDIDLHIPKPFIARISLHPTIIRSIDLRYPQIIDNVRYTLEYLRTERFFNDDDEPEDSLLGMYYVAIEARVRGYAKNNQSNFTYKGFFVLGVCDAYADGKIIYRGSTQYEELLKKLMVENSQHIAEGVKVAPKFIGKHPPKGVKIFYGDWWHYLSEPRPDETHFVFEN